MSIRILNPVPGGATHIGLKRAQRYIKSGCAVLIGGKCLRFNEAHHARKAAQASAISPKHTDGGYNRAASSGIASARQLAGIPVVNGRELTAPRKRLVQRPLYMRAALVNSKESIGING
jgi:hypothetical protein